MSAEAQPVSFRVDAEHGVSGLLLLATTKPRAGYVLAHGAGAGMRQKFLEATAVGLAERGIATFRYNFPYMEAGGKRVDPPALCHATVRAAVAEAARLLPKLPLIAGGKSFGGRMTSQAQALEPLADVRGLAFLGYPLHPPGKPSVDRAEHLSEVNVPMLFLQGTNDEFAELALLKTMVAKLGKRATLRLFEHADHSFHAPAKSGRKDAEVMSELLDALTGWTDEISAA
jgi:predicted alpha/beta-hydrolase family hydrolase